MPKINIDMEYPMRKGDDWIPDFVNDMISMINKKHPEVKIKSTSIDYENGS